MGLSKIISIILIGVVLLPFFSFTSDLAYRRIRIPPDERMVLAQLATSIDDHLRAEGKSEFTIEDVIRWTNQVYGTVILKIEVFIKLDILEVARQDGRKKFFRFSPRFQDRESLELLAGVSELYDRASYRTQELEPLIPIIKDKITTILWTKDNLRFSFSSDLAYYGPRLKKEFLIAIGYTNFIDLVKTFSQVRMEKGERVDIDFTGDNLRLILSDEEFNRALSGGKIWDLFERLRRPFPLREILPRLFTGNPKDRIERGLLTLSWDYFYFRGSQNGAKLFFRPVFIADGAMVVGIPRDRLTVMEKFLAKRENVQISPHYQEFIYYLQEEILPKLKYEYEKSVTAPLAQRIFELYFIENYTLAQISEELHKTREYISGIIKSIEETLYPVLEPYKDKYESLCNKVYPLLFPP